MRISVLFRKCPYAAALTAKVFLVCWAMAAPLSGQEVLDEKVPAQIRFTTIDIFVDSGAQALAAYQMKISFENGTRIVGIEGGEHAAFREPPFYDPRAIQHDRIILAAFNTGKELPQSRTRVATLHVQVTGAGPAEFSSALELAATVEGKRIQAELEVKERNAK